MSCLSLPPFTDATATSTARIAEDAWKSRDSAHIGLADTPDSRRRP